MKGWNANTWDPGEFGDMLDFKRWRMKHGDDVLLMLELVFMGVRR